MVAYDTYSSEDEEEQCPLCIEDMDITDKHFKPCPCGFQICQFCYNSIRSGPEQYNRCPACRRPYDDASIEYKKFSPEDLKREQERKQRKEAERKQREREKLKDQQHHDLRDKKHLASMRVIQKNLVYVIGLNPSIPSEDLQFMLRRDEFFGQYGKIQKIVVNKRVNGNGNPGVGVYVTFARKEDAARCIAAVDGSMNDGKYLRAAYGTTKYCSSYLRGQNCPNPNCMFLHEPGEEADSYNRHPVSSHPSAASSTTHLHGTSSHLPPSHSGPTHPVTTHQPTTHPATAHSSTNHSVTAHSVHAHPVAATHPVATHTTNASGVHINNGAGTPGLSHAMPAHASPSIHSSALMGHPGVSPSPVAGHSVLHEHSGSAVSVAGATLTAANTPPTPVWGKVTPQIPAVSKLEDSDVNAVPRATIDIINADLKRLATTKWSFEFVSNLVNDSTKFPPMFSLPLDDKRRIKVFNKAIAELDKLQKNSENVELETAGVTPQSRRNTPLDGTPVKSGAKKHNSQHLLAHLMRSGPADGQPLERQEEESKPNLAKGLNSYTAWPPSTEQAIARSVLPSTKSPVNKNAAVYSSLVKNSVEDPMNELTKGSSDDGVKRPPKLPRSSAPLEIKKDLPKEDLQSIGAVKNTLKANHNKATSKDLSAADINTAHSILNNRLHVTTLNSQPAETLRRVGGDLLQPPVPVTVNLEENQLLTKGEYVDDGPHFDLKNIPKVELTGDIQPSVWSAIEDFSRLREQTSISEKAYSAAKAQTKKRIKKIRI